MSYFKKEKFVKEIFLAHGGTGDGSSSSNPLPLVDVDAMAIPAGLLVDKVYAIVDVALAGTSALEIGDDDDADGFVPSASITVGTAGMYGWDAKNAGAYLRIQTAGATDAADIYVVPNAKYYSAEGKEVKLNFTGTSSAGSMRVVVEGHLLSA